MKAISIALGLAIVMWLKMKINTRMPHNKNTKKRGGGKKLSVIQKRS